MVSSLIGPQYHDDQLWKFEASADDGNPNDFSVAMVPTFADNFEVLIDFSQIYNVFLFSVCTLSRH